MEHIVFSVDKIFCFSIRNKQISSKGYFTCTFTLILVASVLKQRTQKAGNTSRCMVQTCIPWQTANFLATYALILDNGLSWNYSSRLMDLAAQHFPTVYTARSRREWNKKQMGGKVISLAEFPGDWTTHSPTSDGWLPRTHAHLLCLATTE